MELSFDTLYVAVWVYDINNAKIVWANKAALALWDSSDLEELCYRDLKTGQSDAVKQTLLSYQQGFLDKKVLPRNLALHTEQQRSQSPLSLFGH